MHGCSCSYTRVVRVSSQISTKDSLHLTHNCLSQCWSGDRLLFSAYSTLQSSAMFSRSLIIFQLIKNLGFSSINAQGLTVAPYVVGWFMVLFQAWHSDKTRDRGWHIMASCAVSFIGYIILATSVQKSVGAAYFALFLVVGGNYSLFPLVMSWAANAFSPTSKRGVGTAFIVSISNCVSM
jgi:hypothetical protein